MSAWFVLVVVSSVTEALVPSPDISLILRNKAELKFSSINAFELFLIVQLH